MILQNRIDFKGIIVAENCNPNGDPISEIIPDRIMRDTAKCQMSV